MKIWIVSGLAIAALTFIWVPANAGIPYGRALSGLWAEGARLESQGDFTGAERVYRTALQQSQKLPNSLVKRCSIAFSRVRLESMVAVQAYVRERRNDPGLTEGIEITRIQQNYASWEVVGRELKLSAADCP